MLHSDDDRDRAHRLLAQAPRRVPRACAIHDTGGADRGVAAAIREADGAGAIVFVGHELTESSTALPREGAMTLTIDQAPELQARRSVEMLLGHLGLLEVGRVPTEIPFTPHTRENT